RGGWPTQSSTAAMALKLALGMAVATAQGRPAVPGLAEALQALPETVDAASRAFYDPARDVAQRLARADMVLLAGAGPHYAPAAFGAAKLKELAPIHASAFPLEEYHHYRTQKAGDPMFLIAPDAASHTRALETAIMSKGCDGVCIALVPEGETEIARIADVAWHLPQVHDDVAPIVYSVPLHLFGYHVAMARDALGLGAPRLGG
ncbi:MAG: SIS domain-containing protein, partial [Rhodobacteraceae bacterium]|nr:SIS domain-containing protein [Paracoccaceae bacterium]